MSLRKNTLRVSLIGAGNVGTALAVRLHKSGYQIVSVVSRTRTSAQRCARLVQCADYSNSLTDVKDADLFIIAVSDDKIESVALELGRNKHLDFRRTIVAHTSGVHTSDKLTALKNRGARVCSLHPIQSFPNGVSVADQVKALDGISYGFEGPRPLVPAMKRIVHDLRGKLVVVPKDEKILYHIACVVASNYIVAMLGAAEGLFPGGSKKRAVVHLARLAESSLANALRSSPSRALTGPVARGSLEVVQRHLRELKRRRKDLLPFYKALGVQSLHLAGKRLPLKVVKQLRKLLNFPDAR